MREGCYYFASESVGEGHPDKLCDQISDGVLDACIRADPDAKVALETAVKSNMVSVHFLFINRCFRSCSLEKSLFQIKRKTENFKFFMSKSQERFANKQDLLAMMLVLIATIATSYRTFMSKMLISQMQFIRTKRIQALAIRD